MEFKIKDVLINYGSGATPSRKNKDYYKNGTILWLKTKELQDGKIYNTEEKISIEGYKNSNVKIFPENTITIAMYGATVGKLGILKREMTTNQACCNLVVDKNKADYRFLFYYLKHSRRKLVSLANGAAQQNLNMRTILDFPFPKISLPKQKQISDVLASFDQKIETNNKIIENLEAQAQAIFKSWFVNFEPFQNGEFVESELGMIPEGWEVKKIEEVTESLLGGTPARKKEEFWCGDIPWINSGELNKIRIIEPTEYITKKGLENSSTKLLPKKTTVIAITGATLGQVSLLEIDTCANQSVIGILENENLPYEYIYPFFLNNIDMIILNQTGSSQQHINNNDIKNTKMILPINKVMDAYEQIVSPIYKLVENYMFQNKVLSQIRDTLLPKLMSGEIRLGQDKLEETENAL